MTSDHSHINLPLHHAPMNCWNRIADQLDREEMLDETLQKMPLHEAPDIWLAIENTISSPSSSSRSVRLSFGWIVRAAAVMIVGLIVWMIVGRNREVGTITVAKEMISEEIAFESSAASAAVHELITEGMTDNAAFNELMSDLEHLEKEQSELELEIERNGAIPELIKARIEVENRKAQTTKNLVRIVML